MSTLDAIGRKNPEKTDRALEPTRTQSLKMQRRDLLPALRRKVGPLNLDGLEIAQEAQIVQVAVLQKPRRRKGP